ncbi:hypothetical protein PFMALIP_05871 [Plasmodium falciparum MaliPS096_E11]|uniref:Uncharacterized protein n=1 Tax=Plasmodium falciparum MaliPS096_E11 TaxID=1036727 RepID=A0A024WFY9_PLAFA|nr:hypothetical protein PFMALIP_05871 [Plasmodium falciparum MaliPS096_E11]
MIVKMEGTSETTSHKQVLQILEQTYITCTHNGTHEWSDVTRHHTTSMKRVCNSNGMMCVKVHECVQQRYICMQKETVYSVKGDIKMVHDKIND